MKRRLVPGAALMSRGRWFCRASLVAFALLVAAPAARAGGYHFPDLGSVALSRGGAFVARADNPTALYYNPAGAARLRGTHVLLDGTMLFQRNSFQRRQYLNTSVPAENYPVGKAPDGTLLNSLRMPEIANDDGPFTAPFLAVTSDLGFLAPYRLTVMAGVYGPNAHPHTTYPRYCVPGSNPCVAADSGLPAPQRYDTVDVDVFALYPSLGLAWQPIDGLSIGGVFQLGYVTLGYRTVIAALQTEDPDYDIDVQLDGESSLAATGIFGVHWAPLRWLEIGVGVRYGFSFSSGGEICIGDRQPDGTCVLPERLVQRLGGKLSASPNPAQVEIEVPKAWIVRSGLRYVHRDQQQREHFDVELDFVWEQTSALQAFDVRPVEVIKVEGPLGTDITQVELPHRWEDTWSLRLGGSYNLHDLVRNGVLSLSAGALYEAYVSPPAYTRLDFTALQRIGVGAGVALHWGRYALSVGYAHLFHLTRDIDPPAGQPGCDARRSENCGSDVKQLVPEVIRREGMTYGKAVGNGRYSVSIDEVTVGLRATFGN